MTTPTGTPSTRVSAPWLNPYVVGLIAAVVIGLGAGVIARLLDEHAPYVLVGIFFGLLAFPVGAGGRALHARA
ncbi:MAG: hypothetical protein FJZ92_03855 [Chloroflexi bacterium]|nr:hypothetical protein [Chloroflexota bacterium]